MKKIAIIPARGGSKRIPRKNIKLFLGKPIIAYSIDVALKSNLFDEVIVSTDDEQIAMIAKEYGAKVPFLRSAKNANDYATTVDVLLEVLAQYEKKFDFGCCIYPAAPLITEELITKSYDRLIKQAFDAVFPVLPFSFPIQRALRLSKSHKVEMFHHEYLTTRSQDLEPSYHDSGQFYWFNIDALQKKKKLLTENTGVIVLSELEAQDIDTLDDWRVAELKYKLKLHEKA